MQMCKHTAHSVAHSVTHQPTFTCDLQQTFVRLQSSSPKAASMAGAVVVCEESDVWVNLLYSHCRVIFTISEHNLAIRQ